MTACFYNALGVMVGIDKHIFLKRGEGLAAITGIPNPEWRHVVYDRNDQQNNGKHTTRVTSMGQYLVQADFALEPVPHVPWALWEAALFEGVWLAGVIAMSESKPFLSVASVHGQGAPLAVCVGWMFGINLNCDGLGMVLNPNTVVTTPSPGDYAAAIAGFVAEKIGDWFADRVIDEFWPGIDIPVDDGKTINPIQEVMKFLYDKLVRPHTVEPASEWAKSKAREYVDSL